VILAASVFEISRVKTDKQTALKTLYGRLQSARVCIYHLRPTDSADDRKMESKTDVDLLVLLGSSYPLVKSYKTDHFTGPVRAKGPVCVCLNNIWGAK